MKLDMEKIERMRARDIKAKKNSLKWIVPIAQRLVTKMTSDELYSFIVDTIVAKQVSLADDILNGEDLE
jgi:hypothetical protein